MVTGSVAKVNNNALNVCWCLHSNTAIAHTCAPVASVWVEEVRVETFRFVHVLQMLSNMVHLEINNKIIRCCK